MKAEWLVKASPQIPNLKKKSVELQGAATPGPHHFAMIMDRGVKADRCLQCLDKASPQNPNVKIFPSFQVQPPLDPITLLGYWIGA